MKTTIKMKCFESEKTIANILFPPKKWGYINSDYTKYKRKQKVYKQLQIYLYQLLFVVFSKLDKHKPLKNQSLLFKYYHINFSPQLHLCPSDHYK